MRVPGVVLVFPILPLHIVVIVVFLDLLMVHHCFNLEFFSSAVGFFRVDFFDLLVVEGYYVFVVHDLFIQAGQWLALAVWTLHENSQPRENLELVH